MEHSDPHNSPLAISEEDTSIEEASPDTPRPAREIAEPKYAHCTPEKQVIFLEALASSLSVKQAARAAGMSRASVYRLRSKLKGEPFDLAWEAALSCQMDALADVCLERVINGVEVPHFYKGELIHTSRKYDGKLAIALLSLREKRRPGYMPPSHPAYAYRPDGTGREFAELTKRVARGPERWRDGGY